MFVCEGLNPAVVLVLHSSIGSLCPLVPLTSAETEALCFSCIMNSSSDPLFISVLSLLHQ